MSDVGRFGQRGSFSREAGRHRAKSVAGELTHGPQQQRSGQLSSQVSWWRPDRHCRVAVGTLHLHNHARLHGAVLACHHCHDGEAATRCGATGIPHAVEVIPNHEHKGCHAPLVKSCLAIGVGVAHSPVVQEEAYYCCGFCRMTMPRRTYDLMQRCTAFLV